MPTGHIPEEGLSLKPELLQTLTLGLIGRLAPSSTPASARGPAPTSSPFTVGPPSPLAIPTESAVLGPPSVCLCRGHCQKSLLLPSPLSGEMSLILKAPVGIVCVAKPSPPSSFCLPHVPPLLLERLLHPLNHFCMHVHCPSSSRDGILGGRAGPYLALTPHCLAMANTPYACGIAAESQKELT